MGAPDGLRRLWASGYVGIYALGICIMCGKQVMRWHQALGFCGTWVFLLDTLVYGVISVLMTYSFSEMISIFPFSGGCYGYSRVALGPMLGFFAGMAEMGKYLLFSVTLVYRVGTIFRGVYGFDKDWLPVLWLAFLVAVNAAEFVSDKAVWLFFALAATTILVLQLVFVLGATTEGDVHFIQNEELNHNESDFVKALPYAVFFFSGSDAVRTCVDDLGKTVVPRGLLHIVAWGILISIAQVVAESAYVDDTAELQKANFAFGIGLSRIFGNISHKYLPYLALPGAMGAAVGFLYSGARQMRAMASSGLLPAFLSWGQAAGEGLDPDPAPAGPSASVKAAELDGALPVVPGETGRPTQPHRLRKKPTAALLTVSVAVYVAVVVGLYRMKNFTEGVAFTSQCFNSVLYTFLMASYIVFSRRFSNMDRGISSPFGVAGAAVALAFFVFVFGVIFYFAPAVQAGVGFCLLTYAGVSVLYYEMVAQHTQFFSKEEQETFMKAYIVNANNHKHHHGHHGHAAGASASRSKLPSSQPASLLGKVFANLAALTVPAHSSLHGHTTSDGKALASSSAPAPAHLVSNNRVTPAPEPL